MAIELAKNFEALDRFETDHVRILYYDLPKNYSDEYKSYQYVRFCSIIDGEKDVIMNGGEKITYSNDNYLLLAPHTTVEMNINKETKALVFELSDQLIHKVLDNLDMDIELKENIDLKSSCFLGGNQQNINQDITNIFSASQSKEKNSEFLVDLYAQKLIFDLAKDKVALDILKTNNSSPICMAVKYIEENLETKMNINQLAKELNMSPSNFSHMFKKTLGMSPVNYINNRKLELAIKLLRHETVTDVAFHLGYDNISYFIRLFKDKYAITPKQYQMKTTY